MSNPVISAIVAAGEDWAIGKDNEMLWHMPNDFKYFKQKTLGHPVIMGRKTLLSLGKPLKDRLNIVITRQQEFAYEGVWVTHHLTDALQKASEQEHDEIFVIGGGEIYRQALPLVDRIYLTIIKGTFPEATTHFPALDWSVWKEVSRETHRKDERHAYDYTFLVLER